MIDLSAPPGSMVAGPTASVLEANLVLSAARVPAPGVSGLRADGSHASKRVSAGAGIAARRTL